MNIQPDLFLPQRTAARPLFVREDKTYGSIRWNGDRWILVNIHPVASRMVKRLFPRLPAGQARNFVMSDASGVATDPGNGLKAHVSDQSRIKVLANRILKANHG